MQQLVCPKCNHTMMYSHTQEINGIKYSVFLCSCGHKELVRVVASSPAGLLDAA